MSNSNHQNDTVDTNTRNENIVCVHPKSEKGLVSEKDTSVDTTTVSLIEDVGNNAKTALPVDETTKVDGSIKDDTNMDSDGKLQDDNIADLPSDDFTLTWQDDIDPDSESALDVQGDVNKNNVTSQVAPFVGMELVKDEIIEVQSTSSADSDSDTKESNQPGLIVEIESDIDNENTIKDSQKVFNTDFEGATLDSNATFKGVIKNTNEDKTVVRHENLAVTTSSNSSDKDFSNKLKHTENKTETSTVVEHIDTRNKGSEERLIVETDVEMISNVEEKPKILTEEDDEKATNNVSVGKSLMQINTAHGLNKPNVMIHIPCQDLDVDFIDTADFDLSTESIDTGHAKGNVINLETTAEAEGIKKSDTLHVSDKIGQGEIEIGQAEDNITKNILEAGTNISDSTKLSILKESTLDVDKPENQPVLDIEEVPDTIVSGEILTQHPVVSNKMETEKQPLKQASDITKVTVNLLETKTTTIIKKIQDIQINSAPDLEVTGDVEFSKSEVSKESQNMPSTSMDQDTTDGFPEVEDSLGLLTETSRVVVDDEDQEDDEDDDDDGDFDQDEESNQMTAEHSEDSNAPQSESDLLKDQQDDSESCQGYPKDDQIDFEMNEGLNEADKDGLMDIDENELNVEPQVTSEDANEVDMETETDITVEERTGLEDKTEAVIRTQSDVETVKLSDTELESEQNANLEKKKQSTLLIPEKKESDKKTMAEASSKVNNKQSPSKTIKLEIAKRHHVLSIVDLEESSSDDDVQEVDKTPTEKPEVTSHSPETVTSLHIPNEIEVMCTSAGNATSEIVTMEGEVVISGVPVPKTPQKKARLNTAEVTIKTANTSTESTLVIPETKIGDPQAKSATSDERLEVFSLDSDEEDASDKINDDKVPDTQLAAEKPCVRSKCINPACSGDNESLIRADSMTVLYYDSRKQKPMVCEDCWQVVATKKQTTLEDFKSLKPLLTLHMGKSSQQLVEISDSDSDDGTSDAPVEFCREIGIKFVEEDLAAMLNETWLKYNMDERLKDTHEAFTAELELLEKESAEIDSMLNECQIDTDKLRCDFYKIFEPDRKELPALVIHDTPDSKYIGAEDTYTDTEDQKMKEVKETKEIKEDDDNVDISVVELSKESAPSDLPPPGEISRPPLKAGMTVYAMRTSFGSWIHAKILEVLPKTTMTQNQFTVCRLKFEGKGPVRTLPARCIAYDTPTDARLTIGSRVIALFKDPNSPLKRDLYYSGIVAEVPNPVNRYRYLVFFDDGYAQYVSHPYTRLVCECSSCVWEEVHPYSRQFVRDYLLAYPERPMVRLHNGQSLKTEWNGKWWISRVLNVDASLVQVYFEEDNRTEWIYRGSTRLAPLFLELQAAERHRNRPMPRSNKVQPRMNMPYVEYTRSDEQRQSETHTQQNEQQNEEIRRQRAVAKKSTTTAVVPAPLPPPPASIQDNFTSRVVYYTPKNVIKPYKMSSHTCGPKCKRTDVHPLKDLRTYNPLTKPLLSGWERQLVRYKNHREVMYRAPCGRRIRNMPELHRYLTAVQADMAVDLFDFCPNTHCLAEFVLNRCRVSKKDLSHGKENVPVPCVNYYDDSLPEFCSYNTERTPTAGVPLNLDPDFLCGCDCTDDCADKTKCACWKMTLEGARTIGLTGTDIGYVYKRLPEPLPSGIYECNSRCKCKHTCLNRVAQHPLQLKLQVFKTMRRGWGIRALNDVPKGAFLCVYAGNLLTDATANLDGLNEGDEYLAELDYIEVVEQMKEGFEDDIPDADKELYGRGMKKEQSDEEQLSSSSDEEETSSKTDRSDDEFRPAYDVGWSTESRKNLRRRGNAKRGKDQNEQENKEKEKDATNAEEECITISDDEEPIREPSRFTAQSTMNGGEFVSKYRSLRSYFGKDEACYIMDAKVQGNIGRYLNHSCTPNVFVQNVFVDTHDPRFPWVAFFALSYIRSGTELTWNYNYDVGSVPGKVLYCYCGAANCRGRLL